MNSHNVHKFCYVLGHKVFVKLYTQGRIEISCARKELDLLVDYFVLVNFGTRYIDRS